MTISIRAGFAALFLAFLAPVLIASPQAFAKTQAMMLPVDATPLVAETGDKPSFSIEIADDESERARGLMFREDMPADRGMLFVFERTGGVGFWMKNTPMPLDLVFIGEDGRIVDVLPGEPFSIAPISPRKPVRFVLELKRGTASAKGLTAGVLLRHPAIDAVAGGG
jgi:uncharacterized membrane protein (UPF0127 family)